MTHTKLYLIFAAVFLVILLKLFGDAHTAAVKIQQHQTNQIEQALKDAGV